MMQCRGGKTNLIKIQTKRSMTLRNEEIDANM